MKRIYITLLTALLMTAAMAVSPTPESLIGVDAYEAMTLANAWFGSPVTSYVTPQAVHFVFENEQEVTVPLPEDEMLVSVAPYLEHTHPCRTHFMSGCQGELVDVPVHVTVTRQGGTVVFDETVHTMQNGFLDLWLPRDGIFILHMEALGREVSGMIGTLQDSNTCVTTFQLQ